MIIYFSKTEIKLPEYYFALVLYVLYFDAQHIRLTFSETHSLFLGLDSGTESADL